MFRDTSKQQYGSSVPFDSIPTLRQTPLESLKQQQERARKLIQLNKPTRTSSLQKPAEPQQFNYDPSNQPSIMAHEIYRPTEDYHRQNSPRTYQHNSPTHLMNYFQEQESQEHIPEPEIKTVCPPKFVKSNVQHIVNSSVQIKQSCYLDTPRPFVAVLEQAPQHNGFSLQPVPLNKKVNPAASSPTIVPSPSTSHTRLPKPPLTPLVIPPTPVRSSASPIHSSPQQQQVVATPTRTSSRQHTLEINTSTPGGLSTPGSSRSELSIQSGLSPSTPSPHEHHTMLPSPLGQSPSSLSPQLNHASDGYEHGIQKAVATAKRHASILPETKAEQLVHQGIKFHEAGKLEEATEMFKQASYLDLPIAMFLYGVSLRHGWGCKKSEHLAFQYLQKAAEHAVEDLSNFSTSMKASAAKSELIMAIYELGVSFRHGWGCKKNKETAVYYFKIAADLKDPDAQNDLGHCYYHGHGVKKDICMAAKYYRLADKQGHGVMGNSWIWKSKYDLK
ncbi:hypothetical protein BD560DRAFT_423554 [Blakeslea trispora]|nr:hypothetical protein BD560DRAFT_423554 [Blakeslea trispora]